MSESMPQCRTMNVLVLRRGALGDTIVMLPVVEFLASDGRFETVDFAGVADFAELFEERGLVRRALSSEALCLHRTLQGDASAWVDRYDLVIGEAALPSGHSKSLTFDVRVDDLAFFDVFFLLVFLVAMR